MCGLIGDCDGVHIRRRVRVWASAVVEVCYGDFRRTVSERPGECEVVATDIGGCRVEGDGLAYKIWPEVIEGPDPRLRMLNVEGVMEDSLGPIRERDD